jgi:hypothetical protein
MTQGLRFDLRRVLEKTGINCVVVLTLAFGICAQNTGAPKGKVYEREGHPLSPKRSIVRAWLRSSVR